ncbi:MAG: HIT family protein, partial [Alistipes sp.]|nr:HIT family protein [Alistipes sp.]
AKKIKATTQCKKVATVVLGIEVAHAHIHLVPMNTEKDVDFSREKLQLTPEEFTEIAQSLQ